MSSTGNQTMDVFDYLVKQRGLTPGSEEYETLKTAFEVTGVSDVKMETARKYTSTRKKPVTLLKQFLEENKTPEDEADEFDLLEKELLLVIIDMMLEAENKLINEDSIEGEDKPQPYVTLLNLPEESLGYQLRGLLLGSYDESDLDLSGLLDCYKELTKVRRKKKEVVKEEPAAAKSKAKKERKNPLTA